MLPAQTSAAPEANPFETGGTAVEAESLLPLLTRLTVALSRRRAYAPDHPMVMQAEQALYASLTPVIGAGGSLTLGVAHRELLANGAAFSNASGGGSAVARDLAERLHRRGVGALAFQQGLTPEILRLALGWLASEPPTGTKKDPLPEAITTNSGIAIAKVAYERLILGDAESNIEREIADIWRALAAVAFNLDSFEGDQQRVARLHASGSHESVRAGGGSGGGSGGGTGSGVGAGSGSSSDNGAPNQAPDAETAQLQDELANSSPEDIAAAIAERAQHAPYARRVAYVLLTLANQVTSAPPSVREALSQRLRTVLQKIGDGSLANIVRAAGSSSEQRRLLSDVVSALPAQAVIEWLEVAARATDQQLSHQLLRILGKLSRHANDRRGRSGEQLTLRGAARDLIANWQLTDPNPVVHHELLDHIAQFDAFTTIASNGTMLEGTNDEGVPPELARLVQMSCEIGVASTESLDAARALVTQGHAVSLFAWLDAAPFAQTSKQLRGAATVPSAISAALLHEPLDAVAARALVASLDISAAPGLLDTLEQAASRTARRILYDRLREFGEGITPVLVRRLQASPPWYLARNLLSLLRDTAPPPGSADAADAPRAADIRQFLHHSAEQVRIEAVRILLEDESHREVTLRHALDDKADRIVRLGVDGVLAHYAPGMAVTGSRTALPSLIAARLTKLVDEGAHDEDLAVRAVRALAAASGPTVRDWLIAHVTRRSLLLRRIVLADASPVTVAALYSLAVRFESDPKVRPLLEMAKLTRDGRRNAVREALAPARISA